MLEHEDLKEIADSVDIGDAEEGAEFNKIDRIYCPVCPNNKLIRMVDPLQPHIWFESCPTCYGRFYDAGELKDLSERTISDFIKLFSATERK
jgi:Zn-finger nucleic acid-binding protein